MFSNENITFMSLWPLYSKPVKQKHTFTDPKFSNYRLLRKCFFERIKSSLLAIVDKYGGTISQWTWLYQALLEVSMNRITLWINVRADDWTVEMSVIASNVQC